ncbi:RHS repeat-associated core domain-containing protein [Serratia silvae]|uniref:RHS domain-containing protein n=1 Tax=Serratia silvae TaxID=2824122 RepID=A0ABT0KDC5_9GAMM|nr:RHS repeat-associated core domain-containing protein [Serratia silvae]MCL1030036.1 RHS domain-containing protein [Serratia silvae]
MSGKPAARQGDATLKGGPIVQGAASVLIGSSTGIACSVCPGGITTGNPVNPSLGAKVLPGETDVALPGPARLVINRSYSSYQTPTPAPIGLFGPGWQGAFDVSLQVHPDVLILNDNGGRSLHFESLQAGDIVYSRSEKLWLARGGVAELNESHALAPLWHSLPLSLREDTHYYFVANDPLGPWWVFGYVQTVPAVDAVLPEPLPIHRPLWGLAERNGHQLHYLRDADGTFAGKITGVVDGAGRRFRLELTQIPPLILTRVSGYGTDDGIRLSAVYLVSAPGFADLPSAPLVRYEYNPRGELAVVYDRADHPVRQFEWHPDYLGRMVAHRYAGRPATHYIYNDEGKVATQHNPGGLDYHFVYEPQLTRVTDSLGREEIYHFTGEGGLRRLVKHQNADGGFTLNEFDGSGRLTATVDALGRKTEFELDVANGNLSCITAPDGKQTRYSYNAQHQVVRVIQPDRSEITKEYDDLGRLMAQSDALQQTTRYHYASDVSDQLVAIEVPDGGRQQLAWTEYDQLKRYTDCSGCATDYEYDLWGEVTRVTYEEGLSITRAYDDRGRLTRFTTATGESTHYQYNEAGDHVRTTFPDGGYEDSEYDEWGRVQRSLLASGRLIQQFRHDVAGRLRAIINENGAQTLFEYDERDRLVKETGFDGRQQSYHYNVGGELTQSDDCGLTTDWHYDSAGRVIKSVCPSLTDGSPDEMNWSYTENGLLQSLEHHSAGHRVSVLWQRDLTGRVIRESQKVLDPHEQVRWSHTIGHSYQARGGLAQTLPDGLPAIDWLTYGPGHLLGVALDGKPLLEFERDALHRESSRRFGATTRQTDYDAAGRLSRFALAGQPTSPLNREHRYDNRGLLTHISNGAGDMRHFVYDEANRLSEELGVYPSQYQYDPAGNRLPRMRSPASFEPHERSPIHPALLDNRLQEDETFIYRHDVYGNLVEKRCHANDSEVHRYGYDSKHRLIHYAYTLSWSDGHGTTQGDYIYDPLGRRVGKRILHLSPQGIPREDACVTWYGWDGDRLVLTESDGQRVHTLYQPGSFVPLLRIEGDAPPVVQTLVQTLEQDAGMRFEPEVCDQLHRLEQELREGTLSTHSQQWLNHAQLNQEQLLAMLKPLPERATPLVHLYHCDHLGTPLALINQQGGVDWQAEFDAWGNQVAGRNPQRLYQPIRMQGQHYDEETGLHYNRHRYYDPMLGRYINQDPIGLLGGMNLYSYPLNPLQWGDPLGLDVRLVNTHAVGGWHRKVEVDDGAGTYGISFGVYTQDPSISGSPSGMPNAGKAGDGMVYVDNDNAIKIAESFKTTPEEDALIKHYLEGQIGKTGSYNVAFNNCRTYSNSEYNEAVRMVIKKRVKDKFNSIIESIRGFF